MSFDNGWTQRTAAGEHSFKHKGADVNDTERSTLHAVIHERDAGRE